MRLQSAGTPREHKVWAVARRIAVASGGLALLAAADPSPVAAVLHKTVQAAQVAVKSIEPELPELATEFPLRRGSRGTLLAEIVPAELPDLDLEWTIERQDPGVDVAIAHTYGSNNRWATLRAGQDSGEGTLIVRASLRQAPEVFKEVRVHVGCQTCGTDSCDSVVALGSVEISFALGMGLQGFPAGEVYVSEREMTPELLTPRTLRLSSFGPDVEEIRDAAGALRQVVAPERLVDIQARDANGYTVDVYPASARGEKVSGVYSVSASAAATARWRIENAESEGAGLRRLRVSEGQSGRTFEFARPSEDSWSLSSGGGRQVSTRSERRAGSDRTVTDVVQDGTGNVASAVRTTYRAYPWGESVLERVVDPEGAALSTTYGYHEAIGEPGYGRVAWRLQGDGSWVKYAYDELGRVQREVRPWLDQPFDAPETTCRVTINDYAAVDSSDTLDARHRDQPRTVTELIEGVVVARRYFAVLADAATGGRIEVVERAASQSAGYGDPRNERTVRVFNSGEAGLAGSGLLASQRSPDGRLESHTYERGLLASAGPDPALWSFVPGIGAHVRNTVTRGTVLHPEGLPMETTREVNIRDGGGRELLAETYVFSGTGYERLGWRETLYDERGRMIRTLDSAGRLTETEWDCCGRRSERDAEGVRRSYERDELGRVRSVFSSEGPAGRSTEYVYDGAGRVTEEVESAGELVRRRSSAYDRSGRPVSTVDEAGLSTQYEYAGGGRIVTVTRPGGATEVTERYLDGQTKSVTGSSGVARYYAPGVNADGTTDVLMSLGRRNSPRWERTITDMLGRVVRVELPGPLGVESTASEFDAAGRLLRTRVNGMADMLFAYGETGEVILSGLDVDGNGALEPASADRIRGREVQFVREGDDWWRETSERVYPTEGDATFVTLRRQRARASGFGVAGVVEEAVAIDVHGNRTVSRVVVDRAMSEVTRTIQHPDSSTPQTERSVSRLVVAATTKTGVGTAFEYDALGRLTGASDARTGKTVTHYDDRGWVDYREDPAGNRTEYGYDPTTGLQTVITHPEGRRERRQFDLQGRIVKTWGEAEYPVAREYDEYGQLVGMTTYRGGSGWSSESWPADPGPGDRTSWRFDEGTGLLLSKTDAAGAAVEYTYAAGARRRTRTWARRAPDGGRLAATYGYDAATGELTTVDYNDGTPAVRYTYDRLGRARAVTDAAGVRSFSYDAVDLQLVREEAAGLIPSTVVRSYEPATGGLAGRANGFSLEPGYSLSYRFDANGRVNDVGWQVDGSVGALHYGRRPGSDLVFDRSYDGGVSTSLEYEPARDLPVVVANGWSGGAGGPGGPGGPGGAGGAGEVVTVSRFRQAFDAAGRTSVSQVDGRAFSAPAVTRYTYDAKSQLTGANGYLGADVGDTTSEIVGRRRAYGYDAAGNRVSAEYGIATGLAYVSNELNQYEVVDGDAAGTRRFEYDADGNVTVEERAGRRRRYRWDAENRLVAVEPENPLAGDVRSEYLYDHLGRRVRKSVETRLADGSWAPSAARCFLYEGWQVVSQTDCSGQVTGRFVWGLDLSGSLQGAGGVGGLAATIAEGSALHYLYDANGNVAQAVGSGAAPGQEASYEYDPYGNLLSAAGPQAGANPFRFSTKYFDEETGLYYYGYRYYSPELGRWLSRDPIGEVGGANLYRLLGNEPVGRTDYLGLWNDGNHGDLTKPAEKRGHSDFPGNKIFDYTREDYGDSSPFNPDSTWRHFRRLEESEKDLAAATKECGYDAFQRAAHQMQDFFSHYGQGSRAKEDLNYLTLLGEGHGVASFLSWYFRLEGVGLARPDNAKDFSRAYEAATARTLTWVDRFTKCCCKANYRWFPILRRPEEVCSAGPPENEWGDSAPPPTPEGGYWERPVDDMRELRAEMLQGLKERF